jgi:hypothetical protein
MTECPHRPDREDGNSQRVEVVLPRARSVVWLGLKVYLIVGPWPSSACDDGGLSVYRHHHCGAVIRTARHVRASFGLMF